jgi:hypothetical protein
MKKNDFQSKINPESDFFGKLVNWSHGWREFNIWHYGIALSDNAIFDTGSGLQIFEPTFTPKIVIGVEQTHLPAHQTIDRLIHALDVFSNWSYGLLGWNCEHLARLIATDDPISYEVLKSPPPIPQLNGNGRNPVAKEIFHAHLGLTNPELLTRNYLYRSRVIS